MQIYNSIQNGQFEQNIPNMPKQNMIMQQYPFYRAQSGNVEQSNEIYNNYGFNPNTHAKENEASNIGNLVYNKEALNKSQNYYGSARDDDFDEVKVCTIM